MRKAAQDRKQYITHVDVTRAHFYVKARRGRHVCGKLRKAMCTADAMLRRIGSDCVGRDHARGELRSMQGLFLTFLPPEGRRVRDVVFAGMWQFLNEISEHMKGKFSVNALIGPEQRDGPCREC